MTTIANITFALIATVFSASADGGPARGDVFVLDHNLSAEDCMLALAEYDGTREQADAPVYSCSLDYDF